MKNSKLILTLAVLALMGVGCAKEMKADGNQTQVINPPVVNPSYPVGAPPGQGPTSPGNSWDYGSTVDFKVDSLTVLTSFIAKYPPNNPTNFKLNVNVIDVGDGHFGGQVKISFDDVGQNNSYYFAAGTGKNNSYDSYGTNRDVGAYQAEYNRWFTYNNQSMFSGFFQDTVGAIVLVIDGSTNMGDGQGSASLSGSIWFKNFATTLAPLNPNRYCWHVYASGYNCRSTSVIDKSQPYPTDGYTRLGTFTGLVRSKAFNQ